MILLLILGALDILTGLTLLLPDILGFAAVALGSLIFIKGVYSVIASLAAKNYFDIFGYADLIAGFILFLDFGLWWFGVIMLAKGAYSFAMGLR